NLRTRNGRLSGVLSGLAGVSGVSGDGASCGASNGAGAGLGAPAWIAVSCMAMVLVGQVSSLAAHDSLARCQPGKADLRVILLRPDGWNPGMFGRRRLAARRLRRGRTS